MMAVRVEFTLDHAGLGQLLRSAPIRELVLEAAEGGAEFARHIAPRETGEYVASIYVEDGGLGGRRRDRAMSLIVADVRHAAAVEFGTDHVPAHHVLGRTIDIIETG